MDNNTIEKINEIRQQADIVDIISRHISVTRKGKNFFAICPFHNDTNPSMSISKEKQIYKCFVCNAAGNVFTFIQKYKKIPYMQAVKEVADLVGIEFQLSNKKNDEVINLKDKVIYDILLDATTFYKNSLFASKNALEYCSSRKLNTQIISDFNIGYSPDFNKLPLYLENKGYKKEDIFRSGLVIDTDGELKDRFANRLIFPLTDLNGKIVAYSGRIIEKSDMAKYVNSPETSLFTKGKTLYNYSNALPYIKQEKKMYICEGYMDCIALYRANVKNAVALMGTAFTNDHLKIFKYLGVTIVLCLDGDNPGNLNANKLANELLNLDIEVKVIPHYNDVKDLDEFIDKYGDEALIKHLHDVEMSAFDFNFYVASKLNELENNESKKNFLKKMCKQISKMSNEDIDLYVDKLHKELGFSISTINQLIQNEKKNNANSPIVEIKNYVKLNKYQDLQLRVLTQMIDSPEAIEIFINSTVYLKDDGYRKLAFLISDYYKENKDKFNSDYMIADLFTKVSTDFQEDDTLIKTLSFIDENKNNYPTFSKRYFNDLIYEINEITPLEEELEKVTDELKYANSTLEMNEYIKKAIELKQKIANKKSGKIGGINNGK